MIEAQELRKPFIKVGSSNGCSLSYEFYYTYETCKDCVSILISLLTLTKKISRGDFELQLLLHMS